jgi:hypothetical protein
MPSTQTRQRKAGDVVGQHRTEREMMASGIMAEQRQKFGFRKDDKFLANAIRYIERHKK